MKNFFILLLVSNIFIPCVNSQDLNSDFYDIGTISVTDYFVDSANGNDSNNGLTRSSAKETITAIWNSIPQNTPLTTGIRINVLPGNYTTSHLPNYWENRAGTANHPIIIRSADGMGTVFFKRDINMANTSYFYLIGIDIKNQTESGYGDAFHCENCSHILLRGNSFNGAPNGRDSGEDIAHETIKFNQSQYIYIENNNIQGAGDNAIDWVAVQYGHIIGNRIHDAQSWCAYVKGGSSYVLIEANHAYNCGEGGITAGQGTGFEFMESPWLLYEANYIKIVNNIIYDIYGAGLGVNGGYGILLAHNTLYNIGERSHLLEVVFGERSCDGDTDACQDHQNLGGWGPNATGYENSQPIGNRDIVISNNVFYNPPGIQTGSQHFAIYGPRTPSAPGIPSPQRTDLGLKISGNIIWNGDNAMPLGIEDNDQGCQDSNTTCNEAQLIANNTINSLEPDFIDPGNSDYRPVASGNLAGQTSASIADFDPIHGSNTIPEGNPDNQMVREFSGANAGARPPGAFASSSSELSFPGLVETPTEQDGNSGVSLTINKVKAKRKRNGMKLSAKVRVSGNPNSVTAVITKRGNTVATITLNNTTGNRYAGTTTISGLRGRKFRFTITASNDSSSDSVSRVARVN
jgi:hypothetical protein